MFYVNSTDIVARNQRTKENIIKSLYSPLSSPVHNDSFTNCAYLFLLNLCEFCVRGLQLSHMVLPHAHTMGSLFVFHGILSLCSCLEKLQQQRMLLRVRRDIYSITECHPSIHPFPLASFQNVPPTSSSIASRQHLPLISDTTNMHNQCYTTAHLKNESASENEIIQTYNRYICLLFYCKIA